jgi:hypothetical protein
MVPVIIVALAFVFARHEQSKARAFVAELETVTVGSADIRTMRELFAKCGSSCIQSSEGCDEDRCELIFKFENYPLWRLRLAPFTHFGGTVTLHKNVIDYAAFAYRVSCSRELSSGVNISQFRASQAESPFEMSVHPLAGKPPFMTVRMTASASTEQRVRAFDLNLSCLSRIGGCSGASELAPSLASGRVLSCGGSSR